MSRMNRSQLNRISELEARIEFLEATLKVVMEGTNFQDKEPYWGDLNEQINRHNTNYSTCYYAAWERERGCYNEWDRINDELPD